MADTTSYTVTTIENAGTSDIAFSPDKSRIYVATTAGDIDVFDTASHARLASWHIGTALGALTLSADGSFLLASDPRQPLLYRVSTSTGQVSGTYIGNGNAFRDVEIVDAQRAIVTGTQVSVLDLTTGAFSTLPNASYYSGNSVLTEDEHLTLLAETGISNGPLAVFDDRTGQIVARGDDYQSPNTGFNFGVQAISEAAGLIVQGIYSSTLNLYDLSVKYLRSVNLRDQFTGYAFDSSGKNLYVYFASGTVTKYDSTTFNEIEKFTLAKSGGFNSSILSYGDQVLIGADARYITAYDPSSGKAQLVDLTGRDETIRAAGTVERLYGGGGNDAFVGTTAQLAGDTIVDLSTGDRITVRDVAFADFSFARVGSRLSFANATVDIGTANVRLGAVAAAGGGTDILALNRMTGIADFDGNGKSDLLWREAGGTFSTWQTGGAGNQFAPNSVLDGKVDPTWRIQETFDFDGDGRSDILWRNATTGTFTVWQGSDHAFRANIYADGSVATDWQIAGLGDLNGDGKDDIVWRLNTGLFTTWLSTGTDFTRNAYTEGSVGTDWKIVGLADFNGDGKDDILWRNATSGVFTEWQSTGTGFAQNAYVNGNVSTDWHIDALADFNGDGRDDILWRHDGDGLFTLWQSTGSDFVMNTYMDGSVNPVWQIATTGDFNDDGKADLVWRNVADGTFSIWQSNGNGFDINSALVAGVGTNWQIQGHNFEFG